VSRPESADAGAIPGVCRSPLNAVVARAGLHFWEEPVISGERGSGTVFFSGCNLHCVYCQNHNISMGRQGREVSVARLREIYRELTEQGAHNINLVTPSHFTGAVLASLAEPLEIPVVYNTNGYDLPETLKLYRGKVDIYLPDLKYADNAAAMRYSKVPDYFERAAAAIAEMYAQTGDFRINDDGIMERGVIIRHLILPGQVENTLRVIDYVAKNFRPGQVMFSLMRQYLPCGEVSAERYPELNRLVSDEEYAMCEEALFASGIEDGFVQDAESAGKEFIPAFDGTGV
jgi:putative pyruvate formate lyase activating enzyme